MHTATELFPNSRVAEAVTDYAINMSTSLGDAIHQHRTDTIEYTKVAGLDPLMMINTLEAFPPRPSPTTKSNSL